jgi:hypothetical protein
MKSQPLIWIAVMCLGLGAVRSSLSDELSLGPEPLYIYSFAGNPAIEHNQGVIGSILLTIGEAPNKPLKEKMDALLNQRNREGQLREVFGCMMIEDKSKGCRKVVVLSKPPFENAWIPSEELADAMRRENINTAWAIHITEQFHVGGYFLSGVANKIYADEKGKQQVHRVNAMYWTSYSKQLDATLRSVDLKEKGVKPPLGSKEARAAFWYDGDPSRLASEIDNSPAALAELLSIVMMLPVGSRTVSPPEVFSGLPKLKRLESGGKASCNGAYCGTRVRQEFSDRIHVEADWQGRPWLLSIPRWQR